MSPTRGQNFKKKSCIAVKILFLLTVIFLVLFCSTELLYEDVFAVWEVIWAARNISSEHFVLFIALALVQVYREIVRDNNMDFTDIIKFFNGKQFVVGSCFD